jgi:hypothetical protein
MSTIPPALDGERSAAPMCSTHAPPHWTGAFRRPHGADAPLPCITVATPVPVGDMQAVTSTPSSFGLRPKLP